MDYKLNIGKLTDTIESYNKIIDDLENNSQQRKSILDKLFESGWTGNSKEEFENKHKDNENIDKKIPKYIKYLNNALENVEKSKALELKNECDNFLSVVSRRNLTGYSNSGNNVTISLLNSGVSEISNIIDTCVDTYHNDIQNKFNQIQDILDSFEYETFGIDDDLYVCQASINEQKNRLYNFKDALGSYSQNYAEMESSFASKMDAIVNGKQGKHRTYIFYQPNAKSGDGAHEVKTQAEIEKQKYEMKYPGTEVVLVEINNAQEFKKQWNEMDDVGANIDAVQVILHGSAEPDNDEDQYKGAGFMFFNSANHLDRIAADTTVMTSDTDVLISDLDKKEISDLYFSTCNSANPDIQNVTDAFDRIVDANTITGYDGTALYYYNDANLIESYEDQSYGGQEDTFFAYVGRDANGNPIRKKQGKVINSDRY